MRSRFNLALPPFIFAAIFLTAGIWPADASQSGEKTLLSQRSTAKRPFLGVFTAITPEGERVVQVVRDSPASKIGLEPGDFILEVDGYRVGLIEGHSYSLASELRRSRGQIRLKVRDWRTGKEYVREVDIGGEPDPRSGNGIRGLPPSEDLH